MIKDTNTMAEIRWPDVYTGLKGPLDNLKQSIKNRTEVNIKQTSAKQLEGLDAAICLSGRRTFSKFVDVVAWLEKADDKVVLQLKEEINRAIGALCTSSYPLAHKYRDSLVEKKDMLASVAEGKQLSEVLENALALESSLQQ